jgi:hypothetical protein
VEVFEVAALLEEMVVFIPELLHFIVLGGDILSELSQLLC